MKPTNILPLEIVILSCFNDDLYPIEANLIRDRLENRIGYKPNGNHVGFGMLERKGFIKCYHEKPSDMKFSKVELTAAGLARINRIRQLIRLPDGGDT